MEDLTFLVDLLHDTPPGTCLALRDGSGAVLVRGRSHQTYTTNPARGRCSCSGFFHAQALTDCSHLDAARKHLDEGPMECPDCYGSGVRPVSPRAMLQKGFEPQRCFSCQGSGFLHRQALSEVA